MLFPGTVIACGAIAFLNVLLPSLIKRRIPDRAGLLIGVYLMSLSAGAVLGSLVAVPVFQASGGSAAVALGLWAVPAAVAALVWLPQWRFRTAPEGQTPQGRAGAGISAVVRHLLAWQVMAYMGLQSLTYYAALSWLPVLLRDRGAGAVNAGGQLALVNLGNAATALLLPVLAHRARDQRLLVAVTAALTAAGLGGVWFAPLWTSPAWALMLGFGQGASLGLAIYMMTARSPGPQAAASLSGFAQGGGYLVAAAGPLVTGFLHTASGGWSLPVIVLLLFVAAQCAVGWPAARNRLLPVAAG
jgi:CP family cyanate transporter-like MFS transporter